MNIDRKSRERWLLRAARFGADGRHRRLPIRTTFPADRSLDHSYSYRTMNLAGVFVREEGLFMKAENKGRFYHDGRFATLLDVVNSYDQRFGLGLSDEEKHDLVEYLKSL
jgi:hypothetical protein